MDYSNLLNNLKHDLAAAKKAEDLSFVWQKYLGKEGEIKKLLKSLANLSVEEKRTRGPQIQTIAKEAEQLIKEAQNKASAEDLGEILKQEAEILTFQKPKVGHLHPLTQTIRDLNLFFEALGYSIVEDREIETDEFCFQRLNVPADHPARDMQDTIYIKEPSWLLRTQTSSIEARLLASAKPPYKVVCPGRVYRNEKANKSNHFIFHHYQGVVVMPEISLKDLFGTFTELFKHMYGENIEIRFRAKYYPEVEPGVGPDMKCFNCKGKGCGVCKGVGWIEMGGAGIIHPNVMKMAGLDPKKWRGFAFGLGLDRWVMAKYNITDIRTLLGGDLAYLYNYDETRL